MRDDDCKTKRKKRTIFFIDIFFIAFMDIFIRRIAIFVVVLCERNNSTLFVKSIFSCQTGLGMYSAYSITE